MVGCRAKTRTGQERLNRTSCPDSHPRGGLPRPCASPPSAPTRGRRRRQLADARLYCGTNGCPTTLSLDPRTGIAVCPICGFHRRIA
jgi:hypothetical protein